MQMLQNKTDLIIDNTPFVQHEVLGRQIWVKREDLSTNITKGMPPLAKMRGAFELISKMHDSGIKLIGNVDTKFSKSGQGIAAICKELKINCINGYPKMKEELPEQLKMVEILGAELYELRPNYLRIHYSQVRKYVESKGGKMLPYAISCKESVRAVANEAKKIPEELLGGSLIVCVGSGTMLSGIITGLKRLPEIHGVSSGMSEERQLKNMQKLLLEVNTDTKRTVDFLNNISIKGPIMPYHNKCTITTPFPTHPNYDRKAWKYMLDNIEQLKEPIIFWNIGS